MRFEPIVAQVIRQYGPFIAIGQPGTLRRDGAALSYHSDVEWRAAIEADMKSAAAIIAVAGLTSGLEWEMSTIRERGYLNKTIILFPPEDADHDARCAQVRRWLADDRRGALLMFADLTRACAVFWHSRQQPIIVNAYPAGVGAYEAAVEMALYSFATK
ncbi:MAG: hypothetical protein K2X34_12060 [Hyphomonadaceae bacterium]|nr:hypothetical protein [Hyphomonadaceae bacterium]